MRSFILAVSLLALLAPAAVAQYSLVLDVSEGPCTSPPGTNLRIRNVGVVVGHEYFNVFSLTPCPGGLGSGSPGLLGLCGPAEFLLAQVSAPVGAWPFHFVPQEIDTVWPPASIPALCIPAGVTVEAVCFKLDPTSGAIEMPLPAGAHATATF